MQNRKKHTLHFASGIPMTMCLALNLSTSIGVEDIEAVEGEKGEIEVEWACVERPSHRSTNTYIHYSVNICKTKGLIIFVIHVLVDNIELGHQSPGIY